VTAPKLDEFGMRLQSTAAQRMTSLRVRHSEASRRLLAEMLVAEFGDHELTLLDQLGFLSPGDRQLLKRYRRPVRRLAGLPRAEAG
jgi:hypothetical protein